MTEIEWEGWDEPMEIDECIMDDVEMEDLPMLEQIERSMMQVPLTGDFYD
jgi:hypothetical protein